MLCIASLEIQLVASRVYSHIIENELLPVYAYTSTFLPTILSNLENKDTGEQLYISIIQAFY